MNMIEPLPIVRWRDSPGDDPRFGVLIGDVEESSPQDLHVLQVSLSGHQVAVHVHACSTRNHRTRIRYVGVVQDGVVAA